MRHYLGQGKKIIAVIGEMNKIEELIKMVLDEKILKPSEIEYVIGKDLRDSVLHEGQKHIVAKRKLFEDFSQIGDFRLFIYNSSITSGVSYSGDNYDMGLHFGQYSSITGNQMTQSLFRNRHYKDKYQKIYYQNA